MLGSARLWPRPHSHPRQKSLCGRAGHDSQFMHLSRSSLQELPREQGVVPGEGDQRLGAGRGYSGGRGLGQRLV